MLLDPKIKTFYTVAQYMSYTQAAEALYISQPAVSQQIKTLETDLNLRLFTYENRKLKLTPAGNTLFTFTKSLNSQTNKMFTLLHNQTPKKEINFAATQSVSEFLVPTFLKKLATNHDYHKIKCTVANTQTSLTALRNGHVDFAIIEGNFDKKEFSVHQITKEPFIAVVSPKLGFSLTKQYQLTDLLVYPIITREEGSGSHEIFKSIINAQNISVADFAEIIQVGSPSLIRQLLLDQVGISFIYQSMVQKELTTQTLMKINLTDINVHHDIYFVYLKDSYFESQYLKLLSEFN